MELTVQVSRPEAFRCHVKHAVLLCVVIGQPAAWAQDHLEPEDSVYSVSLLDYRVTLATVLGRVLPYNVPKVIVIPSNQREYIVGLAPENMGCVVVLGRADLLLWSYQVASAEPGRERSLLEGYPRDPLDVPVSIHRRLADTALCDRITSVWEVALLDVRYQPCAANQLCEVTVDGVSYHFSTWVRGMGTIAGQTDDPKPESLAGKLVQLTHTMQRFAQTDDPVDRVELERSLERVEQAMR